jgi:hypothetical protein
MDKDQSLDKLLHRTMPVRQPGNPPGACLDAEILAAWADGSLSSSQRTAAEMHAADCDRCLAVLAAIARTDPPPSVAEDRRWFSVRWLVPLATAAVGMAAWILVPQQTPPAPDGPSAAVVSPAAPAVAQDAFKVEPPPAERDRNAAPQRSVDALQDKASPPSVLARPKEQLQARAADGSLRKDASAERSAAATAAPRAEVLEGRAFSVEQTKKDERSVIRSPDAAIQWRVDGAAVERSVDNGATWRAQATGTTVDLLAGTSPNAAVCWIVGRRGTVLLTTDGATWRRLPFPDTGVDIVAVTAQDSGNATITTSGGRTYHTADGGKTWTLQEIPAAPF